VIRGVAQIATGLGVLLGLTAGQATGQPTTSLPADKTRWSVSLAADEKTLWLAASDGQRTLMFRRGIDEAFQPQEPLNAPLAKIAVSGGVLYAFMEDGTFYSFGAGAWSRGLDLPQRALPSELVGDETGLYALTTSPPPGQMYRVVGTEGGTLTTEPFDAGGIPVSIVRYESDGWAAVAPAPAAMLAASPERRRLAVLHGTLCALWHTDKDQRIECVRLDAETGQWHAVAATPVGQPPDEFWVPVVGRVPTLLLATPASEGGQTLTALRLLGGLKDPASEWRPSPLQLSALPKGSHVQRYDVAFGFNQHAVLLLADQSGMAHLRFARTDAAPTEATVSIADILAGGRGAAHGLAWMQAATLVALMGLLVALFVFRRGAMVAVAALPEGCAVALTVQRLIGFAIDMTPFAVAMAVALGVDPYAALRELFNWASGSGAAGGKLPLANSLIWWGASCGCHTVYALVMELLVQRTAGKVLLGTRVLSETGTAPLRWQIVVRNLLRCVELLPPFWVLGFILLLSRNRQRVGDIFARTLVTRRVRRPLD
jgi:uncharacterized RDD family membrane protein YckC